MDIIQERGISSTDLPNPPPVTDIVKNHENTFYLWTTNDDYLLQEAMQSNGDYSSICDNVRFSSHFTKEEIEARWLALLYHPIHSYEGAKRLSQFSKLAKQIEWSIWEEEIIRFEVLVKQNFNFQEILEHYRSQFHPSRTLKALEYHYNYMKRNNTLTSADHSWGQVPPSPIPSKSNLDIDKLRKLKRHKKNKLFPTNRISPNEIEERGMKGYPLPELSPETEFEELKTIEEIKRAQIAYLRKMMEDRITLKKLEFAMNRNSSQQWGSSFGLLRGNKLRAFITKEKTIIGRRTSQSEVDIDLGEEGYPKFISRNHAEIILKPKGRFVIKNIGKKPIHINGDLLIPNKEIRLHHNCLIEIGKLNFIFEINQTYFSQRSLNDEEFDKPASVSPTNPMVVRIPYPLTL